MSASSICAEESLRDGFITSAFPHTTTWKKDTYNSSIAPAMAHAPGPPHGTFLRSHNFRGMSEHAPCFITEDRPLTEEAFPVWLLM